MGGKKKQDEKQGSADEGGALERGEGAPQQKRQHVTKADKDRARQLTHSIPLGFLHTSLENTLESRKLIRGLFLYIIFVVCFVFFFLARRDMEAEYFMANSLRDLLYGEELPPTNPLTPNELNTQPYFEKTYSGIGNWPDWYDYVESVLVPQLFVSAPQNTLDRKITGQNVPIGSLRIRSKHVRNNSCPVNKHFYPPVTDDFPRICYGAYSAGNELKENFTENSNYTWEYTKGCDGWILMYIQGQYARYGCSGFNVDIPFNTTLEQALQIVSTLRKGSFGRITSVRLLSIEFFTYNVAIDAFTSVKMFVEVTAGGAYIPQQRYKPFRVHNANDEGWGAYYIFFFVFVTFYFFSFIFDWMRHYRITRSRLSFLFDLWNLLDFINLLAFYVTFVLVFYWWHVSTNIEWQFPVTRSDFPLDLQSLSEGFFLQVYFNALNTVIVFLKIMKYLRLNTRLNILQRTMKAAAASLFGVIVIFCLVVTAYALAGYNLYGTGIWDYRNTDEAFAALFRLLVGQFDYNQMRVENRGMTFVFFWSYTILGLFILLNFVVAVVMQGFDVETGKHKKVPLHIAVQTTIRQLKQFILTPGVLGKIVAAIVSSAHKMPEKELNEYLGTYITTMKLSREEMAGDEGEDEAADVETELFFRHDWERIMPRTAIEDIGEEYMNTIWCDVVTEFEAMEVDEAAKRITDICKTVFGAVAEASTHTFMRHKKTLFGLEEEESGKLSLEKIRLGQSSTKTPRPRSGIAMGSSYSFRDLTDRHWHDAEDQILMREQIRLQSGETATTTGELIEDLDKRLNRVEKRYACMAELVSTIGEKLDL